MYVEHAIAALWQGTSTPFTDEGAEAQGADVRPWLAASRACSWAAQRDQETTRFLGSDTQEAWKQATSAHPSLRPEGLRSIELKQESKKSADDSDDSNNL